MNRLAHAAGFTTLGFVCILYIVLVHRPQAAFFHALIDTGSKLNRKDFLQNSEYYPSLYDTQYKVSLLNGNASVHNRKYPRRNVSHYKVSIVNDYTFLLQEQILPGFKPGGSNFLVMQYLDTNVTTKSPCHVKDHFNGMYSIVCSPLNMQCYKLSIELRYTFFQAYFILEKERRPQIPINKVPIWTKKLICFNETKTSTSTSPISWTLNKKGECQTLVLQGKPIQVLPVPNICSCMKQYNDIYMIGTSHIKYVAEFIMHECTNLDLRNVGIHHFDLSSKNIHYLRRVYFKELWMHAKEDLQALKNKPSNAIVGVWIQVGAWDDVYDSINKSFHQVALFEKALKDIKAIINDTAAQVNLQVLATPPISDRFSSAVKTNNFAIGALNARIQEVVTRLGINFFDVYGLVQPCKNEPAKNDPNQNHYFYRLSGNEFYGEAGKQVYLGAFLSRVCNNILPIN